MQQYLRIDFISYKSASELQAKLYELIPIGSSIELLKEFCLKNYIMWISADQKADIYTGDWPDIDFDTRVSCMAKAANAKFPWSMLPFSNRNFWSVNFFFQQEKLVKIDVDWIGTGF